MKHPCAVHEAIVDIQLSNEVPFFPVDPDDRVIMELQCITGSPVVSKIICIIQSSERTEIHLF